MSASIKTAISLRQDLFDEVNTLASELNVSRSRLFVMAVEDFLKQNENRKMLAQINTAFADAPDVNEDNTLKMMKNKQRQTLERDAW